MAACGLLPGRSSSLETPCSFSEPFARSVPKNIFSFAELLPKNVSAFSEQGSVNVFKTLIHMFLGLLKVLRGGLNKFRGKEG